MSRTNKRTQIFILDNLLYSYSFKSFRFLFRNDCSVACPMPLICYWKEVFNCEMRIHNYRKLIHNYLWNREKSRQFVSDFFLILFVQVFKMQLINFIKFNLNHLQYCSIYIIEKYIVFYVFNIFYRHVMSIYIKYTSYIFPYNFMRMSKMILNFQPNNFQRNNWNEQFFERSAHYRR